MANWIIPCNPRYFDIFGAYSKLKTIDWNQSVKSIAVGDTVYIYVGKPVQAIMFKTRVLVTGITRDDVDNSDEEFDLEDNQSPVEPNMEKRWMRLELVKRYESRDLSFGMLCQYGLKGNIQGPRRVDKGIQALIDLVDPPNDNPVQPTETQFAATYPLIVRAETEQTADQPVLRRQEADETSTLESDAVFPNIQAGTDQGDNQGDIMDLKANTEAILHELTDEEKHFRIESKPTITVISYQGLVVAKIKYRVSSLCIEMDDIPSVHSLYDELKAESVAYEKPSADPYRWPGKYAFFVDAKDEETAFLAIIIAAQEGKFGSDSYQPEQSRSVLSTVNTGRQLIKRITIDDREYIVYGSGASQDGNVYPHIVDAATGVTPRGNQLGLMKQYLISHGITPLATANTHWCCNTILKLPDDQIQDVIDNTSPTEEASVRVSGIGSITPQQRSEQQSTPQQRVVVVNHSEDNRRIEKKLDSLIGAIATIYSEKSSTTVSDAPAPEETDKRFRIEATQGNSPVLMLKTKPAITGLIFNLKLSAVGLETSSERYKVFFTNKNGTPLSEPQEIDAVVGEEYNCRFELKSSASEEKAAFLAVQSINAVPEEVRQLIEFPVKIAFAADFGL